MKKISKNFSLEEFTHSDTAIKQKISNIPNIKQEKSITLLACRVLQPARDVFGKSITISSGFRSPQLNKIVGGSATSQHCAGEAADLKCENNKLLFEIIRNNCKFDQLINEYDYSWIHVSYREGSNRGEVLRAVKVNGKTKYEKIG